MRWFLAACVLILAPLSWGACDQLPDGTWPQTCARLTWTYPSQNVDGSALTDLFAFPVYRRCGAETTATRLAMPVTSTMEPTGTETQTWDDESPPLGQTCWYSLTAMNVAGEESARTGEVSKAFTATPVEITPAAPGNVILTWLDSPEPPDVAITVDDSITRFNGSVTSSGSIASGTFTPPDGSLLLVCVNQDENPNAASITVSGGSLTYTQRVARGQADAAEGFAAIYTAPVTTGTSMTVTVARSGGDFGNRRLSAKVYIVEGQDASPIGANNEAGWTTNNQTTSLTATGAGRLFGCGTDWSALGAPTSTDTEDAAHYAGEISVMSAYKAADHSSGTQGINFDAATGTPSGNVVILEILAAAAATASLPINRSSRMAAMIAH